MANRWGNSGNSVRLFWGGSKINADGDCSHKIKRRLLLGRKVMTNLDSILKSRDINLPTKVRLVKAMVFPVVCMERIHLWLPVGWGWGGMDWECGISRCKLSYMMDEQGDTVAHRELQSPSCDQSLQKRIWKRMYTYVSLNHFAVQQKLIQHCKSTILQLKKCTSMDR